MRSRKELIYLNIKDLTQEEIEKLADYELNSCDKCGEIELSEKLLWVGNEAFYDTEDMEDWIIGQELANKGYVAVCQSCYNEADEEIVKREKGEC